VIIMTTTTTTKSIKVTELLDREMVHAPLEWVINADGHEFHVSLLEDDADRSLMIGDIFPVLDDMAIPGAFEAAQALLEDREFTDRVLSLIETKITELNLPLLNDLVAALVSEHVTADEDDATVLRSYRL
jgi:hypothetical protein